MFKLLCGSAVSLWLSQLAVFMDLGHVMINERQKYQEVVSLIMVCFCDPAACIG